MRMTKIETRITVRNIAFATDLSVPSYAALPFAADFATQYGAKIWGVHVLSAHVYKRYPFLDIPTMEEDPEKTEKEFTAQLDERLKAIPHEVVIARGETWNALLSFVEKKNIDLLVMGTHGRTGLGRAMLGSVAEAVFRQCQCPVLTIGPNVRRHPDQLIESKKILHPTDFTPASRAAIPYAISLAQEHQAHLVLLHVIQRPHAAELRHGGEFVSITMQLLRDLVTPEANFWVDSEQLVEYGSPAETILNVARQRAADLIVLGVRKARGRVGLATHFGRATACQVVSEAICPVLTVCG